MVRRAFALAAGLCLAAASIVNARALPLIRIEEISADKLAAKVGRRMRVLVDTAGEEGAIARSAADAPEIDGTVKILKPGKLK